MSPCVRQHHHQQWIDADMDAVINWSDFILSGTTSLVLPDLTRAAPSIDTPISLAYMSPPSLPKSGTDLNPDLSFGPATLEVPPDLWKTHVFWPGACPWLSETRSTS